MANEIAKIIATILVYSLLSCGVVFLLMLMCGRVEYVDDFTRSAPVNDKQDHVSQHERLR